MFEEQIKDAVKAAVDAVMLDIPMVKALLAGDPIDIVIQPITIQLKAKQ